MSGFQEIADFKRKANFQLNGGWVGIGTTLTLNAGMFCVKCISAGYFLHLGWTLIK